MVEDDLAWVVELCRQRREARRRHAPRFWNPAPDAVERHRAFLAHLLADPATVAVRTSAGFVIATSDGDRWVVDDAAMTTADAWASDGVRLLRDVQQHAARRGGSLRVVVPVAEEHRMDAARAVGLVPVEHWWHRDLETEPVVVPDAGPAVEVEGAVGRLVAAPPVYDPGGPVLLVTRVDDEQALHRVEAEAARRGATVSVVTQAPQDDRLASLLRTTDHVLTTAFCEEQPNRPHGG